MGCEQSQPAGNKPAKGAAQSARPAARTGPSANVAYDWSRMKPEEVLEAVRRSVIGQHQMIKTPFGERKLTYADYTASGRGLGFVEDFIREEVLPYYANTHTEASVTGRQTNRYREDARAMIKKSCGAEGEEFACVFTGSGCTTAICTLVNLLGLSKETYVDDGDDEKRPLVVYGPMEHHSNILPWRESCAYTIECPLDANGLLDHAELEQILVEHKGRSRRIVTLSAASNVSGLIADIDAVAAICRKHGALVFFDYACGGPYLPIRAELSDAVFLSPHKFVGGPGTPGVLIVRKSIVVSDRPFRPGGGTVDFVEMREAMYTKNIEAREEGGTPEIVGAIRAGLCFHIKDMVTTELIAAREHAFVQRAFEAWKDLPIAIMGGTTAPRVSVITFLIQDPQTSLYLHYNFIVALLNDLYGIQTRGGCMCAGPYGIRLFHFDNDELEMHKKLVSGEYGMATNALKPGYARLNLNWFLPDHEVDFIIEAVAQVAREGWRMMPQYELCPTSGSWTHRKAGKDYSLEGRFKNPRSGGPAPLTPEEEKALYKKYLQYAQETLDNADHEAPWCCPEVPLMAERWFPVPDDFTGSIAPARRDHRSIDGSVDGSVNGSGSRKHSVSGSVSHDRAAGYFHDGRYHEGEVPLSPAHSGGNDIEAGDQRAS